MPIALNVGGDFSRCYIDPTFCGKGTTTAADVVNNVERCWEPEKNKPSDPDPQGYEDWIPQWWVTKYAASTFWHIVHGEKDENLCGPPPQRVDKTEMQRAIDLSKDDMHWGGWVYVTDFSYVQGLPPDTASDSYWSCEVKKVKGVAC